MLPLMCGIQSSVMRLVVGHIALQSGKHLCVLILCNDCNERVVSVQSHSVSLLKLDTISHKLIYVRLNIKHIHVCDVCSGNRRGGTLVAVGQRNGAVSLWDLRSGRRLFTVWVC